MTSLTYLDKFIESIRFLSKTDKNFRKTNPDFSKIRESLEENKSQESKDTYNKLCEEILHPFATSYINTFGSPEHIWNKCHSISDGFLRTWQQTPASESFPLYITVGNIFYKGENIFNISKSSLKRTLSIGSNTTTPLNAHVWLTWDNGTVIDLTIISTLIKRQKITYQKGMPLILIWQEENKSDFVFEPLLVDNNFFEKVDNG